MSFLGSIVARAAGIAPVVQPRLPSRYESDAYEPQAEESPLAYAASARAEVTQQAPAPVTSPRPDRVAPAAHEATQRPGVEHRIEQHERVVHESVPSPPATPISAPATRLESRPIAERERVTRIESHERTHESEITHHDVIEPPPLRMLIEPRVTSHHHHSQVIAHESSPLLAPRIVREHVETPAAAPTIRVTIGRVDVRAIAAPTPTKAAPVPKKPTFTLDDYIRLRKEGR